MVKAIIRNSESRLEEYSPFNFPPRGKVPHGTPLYICTYVYINIFATTHYSSERAHASECVCVRVLLGLQRCHGMYTRVYLRHDGIDTTPSTGRGDGSFRIPTTSVPQRYYRYTRAARARSHLPQLPSRGRRTDRVTQRGRVDNDTADSRKTDRFRSARALDRTRSPVATIEPVLWRRYGHRGVHARECTPTSAYVRLTVSCHKRGARKLCTGDGGSNRGNRLPNAYDNRVDRFNTIFIPPSYGKAPCFRLCYFNLLWFVLRLHFLHYEMLRCDRIHISCL